MRIKEEAFGRQQPQDCVEKLTRIWAVMAVDNMWICNVMRSSINTSNHHVQPSCRIGTVSAEYFKSLCRDKPFLMKEGSIRKTIPSDWAHLTKKVSTPKVSRQWRHGERRSSNHISRYMSSKLFTTLESCGLANASAGSTVKTNLIWGQCDENALTEKKEDSRRLWFCHKSSLL